MLRAGDIAPDFTAPLDDGSTFRLSDYRGRKNVVLYFYPAAFSGGCTAQACSIRDSYDAVGRNDAVLFGVSADSAQRQADFREKHHLPFPMITDPDKRLLRLYDTLAFGVIRLRVTYVIDKAGIIRAAFRHDLRIGRHVPDILAALAAIEPAAGYNPT
jgi:peroxiredoxin Q/BCP